MAETKFQMKKLNRHPKHDSFREDIYCICWQSVMDIELLMLPLLPTLEIYENEGQSSLLNDKDSSSIGSRDV